MKRKKEIRKKFRESVFERDNHTCRTCDLTDCELDAHHITDRNEIPNGGYVKENGISLCEECHIKAELYHSSNKETHVPGYHPDDLYKLIGSSYEEAVKASEKLG
jgi:5-methylcytosine-specific restriction endonuclease McrA